MGAISILLAQVPEVPVYLENSIIGWSLAALVAVVLALSSVIVYLYKQSQKSAEAQQEKTEKYANDLVERYEKQMNGLTVQYKQITETNAQAMRDIAKQHSTDEDRRIEQQRKDTGELRQSIVKLVDSQNDFNQKALLGLESIAVTLNQLALKMDKLDESRELRRDVETLLRDRRN